MIINNNNNNNIDNNNNNGTKGNVTPWLLVRIRMVHGPVNIKK